MDVQTIYQWADIGSIFCMVVALMMYYRVNSNRVMIWILIAIYLKMGWGS